MERDTIYRNLRAQVQALLDHDAPHDYVLIEVSWRSAEEPDRDARTACIARDDLDGSYTVWGIGFSEGMPSSLNHGRYGLPWLETAAIEMTARLDGSRPVISRGRE